MTAAQAAELINLLFGISVSLAVIAWAVAAIAIFAMIRELRK